MNAREDIPALLKEGFTEDQILETLDEINPELKAQFESLKKEGFSSKNIIDTFLELPEEESDKFLNPEASEQSQEPRDPGSLGAQIGRGSVQGFTDLLELGQLPTSLLLDEEGKKQVLTPGQEALSRASFDNPFIDVDDDIAPPVITPGGVSKLKELLGFGGERPFLETTAQELPRRAVRGAAFGLPGLIGEGAGLAAAKGAEALGLGEGWQALADIVGGILSPSGKGKAASKSPNILKPASKVAQAEIRIKPNTVHKALEKISSEQINTVGKILKDKGEKIYESLPTMNARNIEKDILKNIKTSELQTISKELPTNEQAWAKLTNSVEDFVSKERQKFSSTYEAISKRATQIEGTAEKAIGKSKELAKKFSRLETKAFGQPQVEKALESALFDLGTRRTNDMKKALSFVSGEEKIPQMMKILNKTELDKTTGLLKKAVDVEKKISLDDMMQLKKNLQSVINYESTSPGVRNLLKTVVKDLKSDIFKSLEPYPALKNAYIKVEKDFGKFSKKIGQDAVDFIRKKDAPEVAINKFLVGSNFKTMKELLKGNEKALATFEQQVVKKLGEMSTVEAQRAFREVSTHMTDTAKLAARKILDVGDTLTHPGSQNAIRQTMLADLQKSITSGKRPAETLELMKNPKGYSIVKNTLERSPKGKKTMEILQKQSVRDIFSSVVNDKGIINWEKSKDLFKDPHVRNIIKDAVGKEGLAFFDNLEKISKNIASNLEKAALKDPRTFRENVIGAAGLTAKSMLGALLGGKAGVLAYLGFAVAPKVGKEIYYRMLSSSVIRDSLRKLASGQGLSPAKISSILKKIESELNSQEETDQ